MLQRPKPTDSEEDLLREQEQFLASGSPSTANVSRRPDKRRGDPRTGDSKENLASQRDVVTIPDLPDEIPSLTPAPPKKSRFKKERVRFEDDDAEERLDRHDTHISAVLSRIVERDTSAEPVSLPAFTGLAFPKVLHRDSVENHGRGQTAAPEGRKSIFARQIAAQRAKEGSGPFQAAVRDPLSCASSPSEFPPRKEMETGQTQHGHGFSIKGPLLVSGQGLAQSDSAMESMKIHQENQVKLQSMTESEILEEQRKLLAQLDPRLVDFVKSQKSQKTQSLASTSDRVQDEVVVDKRPSNSPALATDRMEDEGPPSPDVDMEKEEDDPEPAQHPVTEDEMPIKPKKEWLHMDKLEPEKLEWTRDLPAPRRQGTKKAMQARFDFSGTLIPPTEDLPTHLGLHHHGEEPELAGYSLHELFLLSRSQVTQQRTLALNTLSNIMSKAHAGVYMGSLKGSVLSTLLDAGLLFLLRFSLDDSVEGVMSAAVLALRTLLVSADDEECLDSTFSWLLGMSLFPLLPAAEEEEEEDEGLEERMKETQREKEERKSDHDVARQDVVKGLLRIKVLPRLRYILEVVRPAPRVVLDVLAVLIRIARHSLGAATQILDCPRLMETLMSDFLPCSWDPPSSAAPNSLYGLPVAMAMKLLHVLATSGRHVCARLLNSLGARERLSRYLAVEPCELLLEPGEALRCSTEALRLWAVAASYGQACNLYRDLYPVLVRALQAAHRPSAASGPLQAAELERRKALLALLAQVTHTAGCHQELEASLARSHGGESPPPPPVAWAHVAGLQPSLLSLLRGCVKALDDPGQRSATLTLLPSYLLYMGVFYSQLSRQSSFKPVECLQEVESLTSEVLIPLISHQAVRAVIDSLRPSSAVWNSPKRGSVPEALPSLPSLGCSRLRAQLDLTGSGFPLPVLTALCYLLDILSGLHRGLTKQFSSLLQSPSVLGYLKACGSAMPSVSLCTAWLLRHEHHLLYLLLRLAHKLVPVDQELAKHASLFHHVAMALVTWLLPGDEFLAHELLSSMVFHQELLPEGGSGGPEAADLAQLGLQDTSVPVPDLGALLHDSVTQLPSIRGCYLTHLSHLEPAALASADRHRGRTPFINSQLLPELSGPVLPSDWPFLPLVSLYDRTGVSGGCGLQVESLPPGAVQSVTHCLQWLLLLESWRAPSLRVVPPVAKLARLYCVFLCSSDLFLERPIQRLLRALLGSIAAPTRLAALDLSQPPPGLASFPDLYAALLAQYEAVSFGDPLFGCFVLLPLQRRYSATLRLAVFGEHVGLLRSLRVSLKQLPIPLENFTSPPEDCIQLLWLYFRCLVTGALRRCWCPVLYVVAIAHLNAFIFSQDPVHQEIEAARRSMLMKTYHLTDEVQMLRTHLLFFRLPDRSSELGFQTYAELPALRARRLEALLGSRDSHSPGKNQ